jgi:hypothetical protein
LKRLAGWGKKEEAEKAKRKLYNTKLEPRDIRVSAEKRDGSTRTKYLSSTQNEKT